MKEYLKWRQKLTDYVTQLVHIQEQEAITIEDLERIDKTKELLKFMSMQTLGDVSTCPFCGSKSLERLHCVAPRFKRAWKKGVNYYRGVDDTFSIRKCPECGFYTVIWSYKK